MEPPTGGGTSKSHLSEDIATGARSNLAANHPPGETSIQKDGPGSANTLLRKILHAVRDFNWHFVQEEISKLESSSYEHLAGSILCHVISAADNCSQRESILDTVTALVEMAPSEKVRNSIINSTHNDCKTPLQLAVSFPCNDGFQAALVAYLLDQGAVATIQSNSGKTPLHLAATNLCEASIRVLLERPQGTAHRLYDNNLATPLDCALDACRDQMAEATWDLGATDLSKYVPAEYQPCIKLLQDYQNRKKEVPNRDSPSWMKYCSSSACLSSVHVLRSTLPETDSATPQLISTRTLTTLDESVNDVLEGPHSMLEELLCQSNDLSSRSGAQVAAFRTLQGFVTPWIHLPAHNVSEADFPGYSFSVIVQPFQPLGHHLADCVLAGVGRKSGKDCL